MAGEVPLGSPSRVRLPSPQIVAVALILLIAAVLTAPIIWSRILEEHLVTVVAPPLERQFGFRATYEALGNEGGRVFRLVSLESDGRLARAGAHLGDVPVSGGCAYAGDYLAAQSFLEALERAASGERHRISMYHVDADGSRMHALNFDNVGKQ